MADEKQDDVVNPAGMPEIHPPKGGPNANADAPDPGVFVAPHSGVPDEVRPSDVDQEGDDPIRPE